MPTTVGSRRSIHSRSRCTLPNSQSCLGYVLNRIFRYQDYDHMQFGNLRVINEDRVQPGTGFGTHSHREFEIFSYVVSGELEQ